MTLEVLTDWWCSQCGMVTPGGQAEPYRCCSRPLAFRWRADNPPYTLTRRDEEPDA